MALFNIPNQSGATFRAALNLILGQVQSNYYGSIDPNTEGNATAGMLWVDTGPATPLLKIRNPANTAWITIGTIDTSFLPAGTTSFGRSLIDDASASAGRSTLGLTEGIVTTALASQAEAEAGTDNTKLMTPLRAAQAIAELAEGLGAGQTWQTFSRTVGTSYQNLTGRPIFVSVYMTGNNTVLGQVSIDNSTWINVGTAAGFGNVGDSKTAHMLVPDNSYYRVSGSGTINTWAELR